MFNVWVNLCFKKISSTEHVSKWKSKGLSDESIRSLSISDGSLALSLNYINVRPRVKVDGKCLRQDKVTFVHKNIVNIYIIYEINLWNYFYSDDPTLPKLWCVKFVKNADVDKYKYSGYGIGFDVHRTFSNAWWWIWRKRYNSSSHVYNKKKGVFILGKSPSQGDIKRYHINCRKKVFHNFSEHGKKYFLSLIYNGDLIISNDV